MDDQKMLIAGEREIARSWWETHVNEHDCWAGDCAVRLVIIGAVHALDELMKEAGNG